MDTEHESFVRIICSSDGTDHSSRMGYNYHNENYIIASFGTEANPWLKLEIEQSSLHRVPQIIC